MEHEIETSDLVALFKALKIIRDFKIKAGGANFRLTGAEDLFKKVLDTMENGCRCPGCGAELNFYVRSK